MRFFVSAFLYFFAFIFLAYALVGYWPLAYLSAFCSMAAFANTFYE